ncbi:Do family serine endopeptidase [Alsobacter sp. SYSU M60028]|uniref:Probable periplasmic serine endoprotease DegP-like n=1 Tax=Alsobacter ponti TaxID=2962936 RepID=A0ABT1L726_9HYPH|nr:Do family serine endopeptidase [Alsobacter ponti]MCP8937207.1 Do family serine endopeptidase [Alsobacter ponti]
MSNRLPASLRRFAFAVAVASAAAATALPPTPALARAAPESFADLAANVIDAVVNISAATTVTEQRSLQAPQLPPGSPFQEFFDDFFNNRGPNGGGDAPRPQRRSSSLGSGFVIDPSGIVVTNNHVIGDANDVTVIFADGRKLKAEIVGKDAKMDLAVLRVKSDKPLKAVKFGDSEAARIGDWVMAIGNPFGLGGSVSAGIVSARNRDISDQSYGQYIQTDAAINKGNSGGPLFNMDGDVIGINTAILSPSGGSIGIGFAVPSALAKPVIDQLQKYGETRRGWLGVRIQNVDDAIAESLGLGKARGALVAGIDDKGPAKPAGLEAGDVIVKFDGVEIKESKDLPRIVGQTPVDKVVDVVIVRKGQELTKSVKLGRLEEGEKIAKANAAPGEAEKPVAKKALGLELSPMSDELRKRYSIKEGVRGVLVTRVDPNSPAADKRITPGDVVVEVQQEPVSTPDAIVKRLETLKKDGKKSALLLVANAQGDVRFVAIGIE